MVYGPIQLVVVHFEQASLPLDFVNQLRWLRDDGIVRLVDAVFIAKDEHGNLTEIEATDLDDDEAVLLGTLSGALFGYGMGGEVAAEIGAAFGGLAVETGEFGLDCDDIDDIADLIPTGSAVAFILLEHLWAVGLKEAVRGAKGRLIAQGWVTPDTIIAMGKAAAQEAEVYG